MPVYSLSEAELYIMHFFWSNGPMKSDELAPLVAQKGWKATTLLTFLSRLASKGMLTVEKQGRTNLYLPAVTKAEYRQQESHAFLRQMYDGSAKNFLAAMVDAKGISAKDLQELRSWLETQEVDDA